MNLIVPNIYEQLVNLCPDTTDPSKLLLDFYVNNLILSIPAFDDRYSKIEKQLSFLLDNTATTLESVYIPLAESWFLRKKQSCSYKNLKGDPKSILKKSIKDLKLLEAELQMVIWLECLRICKDTKTSIPQIILTKVKQSKKKSKPMNMEVHLSDSLQLLTDRLLIWTLTNDTRNDLWTGFVKPVIVNL
jgi:hypothetical protein